MAADLHIVTGAFGYSGRYIARRLLDAGHRVVTLTNSPARANPFAGAVEARPFSFDDPTRLAESMAGGRVLYNTYWVRFNHREFTHQNAVENTLRLFEAAGRAGIERIVHVSIANPALDSPLEYFRGKAELERALINTGISHAILRPTVLFGPDDILINNIAWALRHFPVFTVFGDGRYRLRPIYVDDLAALAVAQGVLRSNAIIDAVGPESFTYRELVTDIGRAISHPRPVVGVPPGLARLVGRAVGWWMDDVMITREEIEGLMAGLLDTPSPPAGPTKLSEWARAHADALGRRYASELARRRNRTAAYASA